MYMKEISKFSMVKDDDGWAIFICLFSSNFIRLYIFMDERAMIK